MKIFSINTQRKNTSIRDLNHALSTDTCELIVYDRMYKKYLLKVDGKPEIFVEEGESNVFLSFLREMNLLEKHPLDK
ncbi:uncharacterized protein NEMAJ01_2286 [Nematocida major]|uniref:uncharacterized protein n=1 Tax=Nematocida major TaxID=1912982 RepID=UPI0020089332|nr:uncharacterized protein NEMAJ01_2286 [Nematocida major]KAH9387390.1 hypothetical protein NEMAJ01_2286 [Nematocida major]